LGNGIYAKVDSIALKAGKDWVMDNGKFPILNCPQVFMHKIGANPIRGKRFCVQKFASNPIPKLYQRRFI